MPKILIVDDDAQMCYVLRRFLEFDGHDVTVAPNGKVASGLYHSRRFDLILTDIYMPEMDGLELLMELRKEARKEKVIAMTGDGMHGPFSYLMAAKKFGACGTLQKPIEVNELMFAVRSALTH